MSNVMVSFRLDRDMPLRVRWRATDGVPGEGYKAQVTGIVLPDGTRLAMHGSSILEQAQAAGDGIFTITFTGMVGYAHDHADFEHVDKLADVEVDYEIEFVHEDGRTATAEDYEILDRPRARAKNLANA
jgi:hypothetical protein